MVGPDYDRDPDRSKKSLFVIPSESDERGIAYL